MNALSPPRALPRTLLGPALLLSLAIALPLHPEGYSFAQLLYATCLGSPLEALVMLLGFGSPFVFGMIVALLTSVGTRLRPEIARRLLVTNLSLLHAQLLLVAYLLWAAGEGVAPLALLGFAALSGLFFVVSHAQAAAQGGLPDAEGQVQPDGPTLAWMVRWGATMIVAICGWARLQLLADVRLGWAVDVMVMACVAMTVLVVGRRPS